MVARRDVDIALDHRKLKGIGYKTMLQLLLGRGYIPKAFNRNKVRI